MTADQVQSMLRTHTAGAVAQAVAFAVGRKHPALPTDALIEKVIAAAVVTGNVQTAEGRATLAAIVDAG